MSVVGALTGGRISHGLYRGSVLPRIASTRVRQGVRLDLAGAGTKDLLIQLVLVSVFLASLYIALRGRPGRMGDALATFLIMLESLRRYLRWKRLRRATAFIRPWPIRLGQEVSATLRVFLKDDSPASALAGRRECVEEVKISSGRAQQTRVATMYALDLPAADARRERAYVTTDWRFAIPDRLPPSLAVPSNKVKWRLATLVTTGDVEIPIEFELLVIPEVRA